MGFRNNRQRTAASRPDISEHRLATIAHETLKIWNGEQIPFNMVLLICTYSRRLPWKLSLSGAPSLAA
jgi:hypothetical protein